MAALILPRRLYEQPQGAVELDTTNPFYTGLKNALIVNGGTLRDALACRDVSVTAAFGSISYVATSQGVALHTPNGGAARIGLGEDWSGPSTTLWVCRINAVDSPWGGLWSKNTSGTTAQLSFGREDATDDWYFGRSEVTTRVAATSISGDSGAFRVLALTNTSSDVGQTCSVYRDGAFVGSGTDGIAQNSGSGDLYLGCERNALSGYDSDVYWLAFCRYNRVLSAAEIAELSATPWQIFRATPRRIYFSVGGTTFNQTLSATATGSASAQTVRALLSNISTSSAATALYLRNVSLARNAGSSATPTVSRGVETTKSASASGTPTLSASKSVLSSLTASVSGSAVMSRTVGLIRSASSTVTPFLLRTVSLIRSATGTGTATLSFPSNAQYLRPDSNVTQTSFTGGFAEIDETTASDADFAYGTNNTAAVLEVGLSNPIGTPGSGTTTVRYRIAKTNAGAVDGGGNAVTVTAAVYQGTTLISADAAQTATGTWTQYSWTPSMAGVTDWTDLRLRFTTSASGGTAANRRGGAVSWAEVQTPAASSGTEKTLSASATATATIQSLRALISSLSATATGSASTSRVVSMVRSATSSAAAVLSRVVAVTKDAASTATASVSRTLNKAAMAATSSTTATLVKATATAMTLTAAATGSAVMSSLFGLVLSASAAGTALYTRVISISRAVTATGAASVTRGITKALNAAASAIASLVKQASSAAISALRTLAIAAENRIRSVSAENRIHPASAEDRDLPQ